MKAFYITASTLDGYDRAKIAEKNYVRMHGNKITDSEKEDPELFAIMKKYIYGDLSRQIKLSDTERQLITIVVLATNQNHKFLKRSIEGALSLEVKPLENQGTTTDLDRFEKGLAFQVNAYEDRINKMREMLTMAVIGTLDAGATNEEVIGVITTLNALRIANEVFSERKK